MNIQVSLNNIEVNVLLILLVVEIYLFTNYFFISKFIPMLLRRSLLNANSTKNNPKLLENTKKASNIELAVADLEVINIEYQKNKLGQFVFNIFEFLAVTMLTTYFMQFLTNSIVSYMQLLLMWIAIKTIGNFGKWKLPIFGNRLFQIFIIETIFNLFCAGAVGWIIASVI